MEDILVEEEVKVEYKSKDGIVLSKTTTPNNNQEDLEDIDIEKKKIIIEEIISDMEKQETEDEDIIVK